MVHRGPGLLLFLVFLATCLVTDPLLAGPTASLTGRVTDSTGGVIAGVRVAATNVETNVVYSSETNPEGLYNIPNLPAGTYRVILEKFAFRTINKTDVELHVQDEIKLNFSMELGSVTQSVTIQGGAPLIQAGPQLGGTLISREIRDLPLVSRSPISLARTLPGAVDPVGSYLFTTSLYLDLYPDQRDPTVFPVNGQRPGANNYLLDGTENNDIQYTGVAEPFDIADAVEEISVQTGNFGVEFGRASGGVFNVVTKSGTNTFHGTMLWRYQSQRFNSAYNGNKNPVISHNVYGFTLGGPVHRDRTFFFAGFQQDTNRSTQNTDLKIPTEAAVDRLRSLFPSNPRLGLYLKSLGSLRGLPARPFSLLQLGRDPLTGVDRGSVQFAWASLSLPASSEGPQWLVRFDHNYSEDHRLAVRYIYDAHTTSPVQVYFPGFITDKAALNHNLLFTDHYNLSRTWSNEFRFSYARLDADEPEHISPKSVPEARTQPRIVLGSFLIAISVSSPGILSQNVQFRHVNNMLFQEMQTKLSGHHVFSYGLEFLRQFATQRRSANYLGELDYNDAGGYSAFANYLDDFGNYARKDFSATTFNPDQFRQTYFFQDVWLPAPSLSFTLGLRYENFGQVANALRFPAFAGFNPDDFLKPNRVNPDNNNFGPAFAVAWSPTLPSGILHKLFDENKTVWRGGYQISYDTFSTAMLSQQLAQSSPNGIRTEVRVVNTGRGSPNFSAQLPVAPGVPSLLDNQTGVLDKDLRSPYTERWSFGFQRQLGNRLVIDGSYVGSESHKLTTWDFRNPMPEGLPQSTTTTWNSPSPPPLNTQRLHPGFGQRDIRASEGNSSYHAMQWSVDRRFANGFLLTASYTWSRNIDSTSDGIGLFSYQSGTQTSVPIAQGGLRLDRGPSDLDRSHRLTFSYVWDVPGPSRGFWRQSLGGWSLGGITSFQSGAPFTVLNGADRNGYGEAQDRPDIGNPAAPLNSRAVLFPSCSTGYQNPDNGLCVTPTDVHWVQGTGFPNANTVGRNTLRTRGINNFDLRLSKSFHIAEQKRLEFRWEALNALNHPQFIQVLSLNANIKSSSKSQFLNRDLRGSGNRVMWLQMKLVF